MGKPKRITTDHNALASYQLESNRFPVKPGDLVQIPYKIRVQANGRISLGLLNTQRNGWHGEELVIAETKDTFKTGGIGDPVVWTRGVCEGVFERTIPEGETEASLVFRNYHLEQPGQSTFEIDEIDIKKKDAFWLNSTGIPASCIQERNGGQITLVTDHNNHASYQLVSDRFSVEPDDLITLNYKIAVQPGGKMSLGLLSTSNTWWYDTELVLGEGVHEASYQRIVPAGESESSLVCRNYHLGVSGQTTFTIEYLDFQKKRLENNILFALPKDLLLDILQNCSLPTIGNFSRTSQNYQELSASPAIWNSFMKKYDYPVLPEAPLATKFDFMSHYLEYDKFKNPADCKIKVKNLCHLLNIFPPNADNESYFTIGQESFMVSYASTTYIPKKAGEKEATLELTASPLLELLDPKGNVTFTYKANNVSQMFTAEFSVTQKTYQAQDITSTPSNQQHLAEYCHNGYLRRPYEENFRHNWFTVSCITHEGIREWVHSPYKSFKFCLGKRPH